MKEAPFRAVGEALDGLTLEESLEILGRAAAGLIFTSVKTTTWRGKDKLELLATIQGHMDAKIEEMNLATVETLGFLFKNDTPSKDTN